MNNEEKIQQVEEALDHHELITQARASFQHFQCYCWDEFCYGFGVSPSECRSAKYFYEQLVNVLGKARADEIYLQESIKFTDWMVANHGYDSEVTHVFLYGTEDERRSFPIRDLEGRCNAEDDAAIAEWVADRQHQRNRQEYARAFYGVAA
jgi:hypothetical protein